MKSIGIAIAAISLFVWTNYSFGETVSGQARVLDGDTIVVSSVHVRFAGIDAPELHQWCDMPWGSVHCGEDAKSALINLINNRDVKCVGDQRDKYGRMIGTCYVGNTDLNREMVKRGLAVAYTRYSNKYVPEQSYAQHLHLGIWAGKFTMPEEWRREHR